MDENAPISADMKAELRKECERLAFEEVAGIRIDYEKIGPFLKLAGDGAIRRRTLVDAMEKLDLVDGELRYRPTKMQKWGYCFSAGYEWFALAFSAVSFVVFFAVFFLSKKYEWSFLIDAVIVYACAIGSMLMNSSERCARKVEREMLTREKEKEAAAASK